MSDHVNTQRIRTKKISEKSISTLRHGLCAFKYTYYLFFVWSQKRCNSCKSLLVCSPNVFPGLS